MRASRPRIERGVPLTSCSAGALPDTTVKSGRESTSERRPALPDSFPPVEHSASGAYGDSLNGGGALLVTGRPWALVVRSWPGQRTTAELERCAASGECPRTDYVELARRIGADVVDREFMTTRAGTLSQVVMRRSTTAAEIVELIRRARCYRSVLVWGEPIGFPLATVCTLTGRNLDVVTIATHPSRPKRAVFLRRLGAARGLRAIVFYGSAQMAIASTRFGLPESMLHLALQPVDEHFWRPSSSPDGARISSVGSERDYDTLVKAVRELDVNVEIAVGSKGPYVPKVGEMVARDRLPENVHVRRQLGYLELRDLYANSRFVVVPLWEAEFDAGVTTITEAMAMGKAVVVTRTRGQVDVVQDGETGLYVAPGDPRALRAAIAHLLRKPDEAERMGRAGRDWIERRHSLDRYVERLEAILLSGVTATAMHRERR